MTSTSTFHLPQPAPLSRTSSAMSFSSTCTSEDDASSTVTVMNASRRTRKRFTNVQLTMLENLFHQNSHPSREDREAVAKAGGMEIKSVTIWFQNKRQTERKTAASNNGQGNTFNELNVQPNITSTIHTFSLHNDTHNTSRTASPPFSASSRQSSLSTSTSSRPSLDRVASRSELRVGAPRTPSRRHNPSGQIYDNMPSSPLAPPISPPARDFIDFGKNAAKTRRTLEWACAAARVVDKDGYASGMSTGFGHGHAHAHGHNQTHAQFNHHHSHTSHSHSSRPGPTSSSSSGGGGGGGSAVLGIASAEANFSKSRGRTVQRERSHGRLHSDSGSGSGTASRSRAHGHGHGPSHSRTHTKDRSTRRSDGSVRRVSGSSMSVRAEGSFSSTSSGGRSSYGHAHSHGHSQPHGMDVDGTDSEGEDDHEAITPPSTWGKGDARWTSSSGEGIMSLTAAAAAAAEQGKALPKGVDDDDMFKAALALCGLGRRT